MNITDALNKLVAGEDLSQSQTQSIFELIMTGEATPAQIGGFLVGLRMKGETIDEITAAAEVMRKLATKVKVVVVCDFHPKMM